MCYYVFMHLTPYIYWVPEWFACSERKFADDAMRINYERFSSGKVFRAYQHRNWSHFSMTQYWLKNIDWRCMSHIWVGFYHQGFIPWDIPWTIQLMENLVAAILDDSVNIVKQKRFIAWPNTGMKSINNQLFNHYSEFVWDNLHEVQFEWWWETPKGWSLVNSIHSINPQMIIDAFKKQKSIQHYEGVIEW